METSIYKDIETRTGGDIYIGVVGPCRTGKSTFITTFMNTLVLPSLENGYEKQRVVDELPQSGDGKTIMTTQPKFVPNEAAEVRLEDGFSFNVRLVDCVGYMISGAIGGLEDEKPRMISTPWSDEPMPFEQAADIGTKKVITDHSTVGVVVTTDGSITDIDRESYEAAEERVVKELKALGKPFVIVVNTIDKSSEQALSLKQELEEKYDMPVMLMDVMNMSIADIDELLKSILYEFPIKTIRFNMPGWISALGSDHHIISDLLKSISDGLDDLEKMRDHKMLMEKLSQSDDFSPPQINTIALGRGSVVYDMDADNRLFYKVVEEESGYKIENDAHLMSILKELVYAKKQYDKVKTALESSYTSGYGIISPSLDEIDLQEPQMLRQGNKYAVKLFANAPSIHLIRTDITTEVCPIIGTEKQSTDVLDFLNAQFEENKDDIWQANIFGKSLQEVVTDGLAGKNMPDDAREKLTGAMQKMSNKGKGHLICFVV
ncbi:MAG: stage IV sporulation protein A [Clostridia bacterium]|nr:stage IV sporulation protein A [Clostridia bacterium]